MAVVTVSRSLGSDGDHIAEKLAEALGYEFLDNALIAKVAEKAGVRVQTAEQYDETARSKLSTLLMGIIEPRMGKALGKHPHLDPEKYLEHVKEIITSSASLGNVVIVGRGSQFIMGDFENAFHVRIVANLEKRIQWVMHAHGITEHEAVEMIHKSDHMRKTYTLRYLNSDLEEPTAYHLTIDSSRFDMQTTVSIIRHAVENFSSSFEYIPGVRDRRHLKDRRTGERRKWQQRTGDVEWTAKEIDDAILKQGRPLRNLSKPDRRKTDRRTKIRREEDRLKQEKD